MRFQAGRQSHGRRVQRACAAPASRSDSPHRSPAAFRRGRTITRRVASAVGLALAETEADGDQCDGGP
jgi:hypothetical protein